MFTHLSKTVIYCSLSCLGQNPRSQSSRFLSHLRSASAITSIFKNYSQSGLVAPPPLVAPWFKPPSSLTWTWDYQGSLLPCLPLYCFFSTSERLFKLCVYTYNSDHITLFSKTLQWLPMTLGVQIPSLVHKAPKDPTSASHSHLISFHFPLCSLTLAPKHSLFRSHRLYTYCFFSP